MIKKTLGGDRLGSGNRMKQELHNYFRSNHNLSCARITSAAPGVLYPLYTNIGLTGDTWDIDLNAFVRTLPTEGPMFGAFKLQVDVFTADFRLYQAILHNNTTDIGMQMNQVYLPKFQTTVTPEWIFDETSLKFKWKEQINKSSLLFYLGLGGVGRQYQNMQTPITRKFNAIPMLAYYDIFKNYYANKQEENAYLINYSKENIALIEPEIHEVYTINKRGKKTLVEDINNFYFDYEKEVQITIKGRNLAALVDNSNGPKYIATVYPENIGEQEIAKEFQVALATPNLVIFKYLGNGESSGRDMCIIEESINGITDPYNITKLSPFPLNNIDLMRKYLLTHWDLGDEFVLGEDVQNLEPYHSAYTAPQYPMQGLVTKCYQSDMFNNWLDNEFVQMVSEYSKVTIQNGSFSMDQLNLAKKMYNHYNRVAISGGTYDDWQLAAYGEENYGKCEKPVYHGGMSAEVIFDEVVSSVASADQPLGTLGGRGTIKGSRGGHVIIKCKEACVIMVMVSLTPRVTYSQGNAWYMTNLDSMDDLHKPEFDRIGFQNLMGEQMAWWSAQNAPNGTFTDATFGKQPAWLHYQTDVDKCFGDFAQEDGKSYMVLQRLYDYNQTSKNIQDVTTYIDPAKYNYPFAVNDITSQNFWIFLNMDIKARRKMSAKQIPNF